MTEISLWDGAPPGTEDWTHTELPPEPFGDDGVTIVRNVVHPTLTPYLPPADRATGAAAIVCPGGAYHFLAIEHEGRMLAEWLCERGVAAYVLKYRVVPTPVDDAGFKMALAKLFSTRDSLEETTLQLVSRLAADGGRAVELVRARHSRVAMIGFSAGARLTFETIRSANPPDVAALIYGPPVQVDNVPSDAPPVFVLAAENDPLTTRGSRSVYDAWRAAKRPVELHLYEQGGHGFGMNKQGLPIDGWGDRLGEWLHTQDVL
jgi:acetyl esterase/lipase